MVKLPLECFELKARNKEYRSSLSRAAMEVAGEVHVVVVIFSKRLSSWKREISGAKRRFPGPSRRFSQRPSKGLNDMLHSRVSQPLKGFERVAAVSVLHRKHI